MFIFIQDVSNKKMVLLTLLLSLRYVFALRYKHERRGSHSSSRPSHEKWQCFHFSERSETSLKDILCQSNTLLVPDCLAAGSQLRATGQALLSRPHAAAEMLRLVLIKWDWSALNDGGRNNLSFAILLHRASSAQTLLLGSASDGCVRLNKPSMETFHSSGMEAEIGRFYILLHRRRALRNSHAY